MKRVESLMVVAMVLVVALCLAACGQSGTTTSEPSTASSGVTTTQSTSPTSTSTGEGRVFTIEELAQFDGKEGRFAYVAVDGVVYDVTGSRIWPEGVHGRCSFGASAGRDLSDVIGQAPANMRALLEQMPVVGRLAQ